MNYIKDHNELTNFFTEEYYRSINYTLGDRNYLFHHREVYYGKINNEEITN